MKPALRWSSGALRSESLRLGTITSWSISFQGEQLNFESADAFFSHLTGRRWEMIHALQGAGEVPVRKLARRVGLVDNSIESTFGGYTE